MAEAPDDQNKATSAQVNLYAVDKLVTAITGNALILTNVLLFGFAGFFLYLSFMGKPPFIQQSETIDTLGRVGSVIVGGVVLYVALRSVVQSIGIIQGTKPVNTPPEVLIRMAENYATLTISAKVKEAIKKLHATQKDINALDVYKCLNNEQIINYEDYEEIVRDLISK